MYHVNAFLIRNQYICGRFMKKLSNISVFQRTLFFTLGMLVAAFVVSQEVLDHHCTMLVAQTQEQEQSDNESSETELGMLSCDVVLPGSAITFAPLTPVFIREIAHKDQVGIPVPQNFSIENTAFFKTLFRQIISTNAP